MKNEKFKFWDAVEKNKILTANQNETQIILSKVDDKVLYSC